MDQSVRMLCAECSHVYTFRLTDSQYNSLATGTYPREVIAPEFEDHILLFVTSICYECWHVRELEFVS